MQQQHPQLAQAFALSKAGRNPEAILIINQLAAQNEPGALFTLAEMKWRGGMVAQDLPQARDLYRRAGEAGHRAAAACHTNLLASGVAGPRDWPGALERLRREAQYDPRRRQMLAIIKAMELTPQGEPASLPPGRKLSMSPDVTLFPGLFSVAECDYLRQVCEPGYQPALVADSSGRFISDPIRTSDASTIHWLIEDPATHALNRRLAAVSGTLAEQGEALQLLRYLPGQQYRNHLDFVRASENQRFLTALVYLNHDYQGGETCFIQTGLKVKGRKGEAIVFRNSDANRNPDPMSEHASLPVTSGIKYLASRWIREKRWSP